MPEEQQWSRGFSALRQLLLDFLSSDVTEIDLQQGDLRLRARKGGRRSSAPIVDTPTELPENCRAAICVVSPLTGVIYMSPSPQATSYVAVGDYVEAGQIVALVEAMKVFNEVRSEHAGRVVRILASSGDVVQKDQPILELAE